MIVEPLLNEGDYIDFDCDRGKIQPVVQSARLADAVILPRRNARLARPNQVEQSACNTGAVCVKIRLLWFAQSAEKVLKLAKHVPAVVAQPPIGRVFDITCAKFTIINNRTFCLLLRLLYILYGNMVCTIDFHCNGTKILLHRKCEIFVLRSSKPTKNPRSSPH
jgi:hypothetical protein